jgi:hypothetical protein
VDYPFDVLNCLKRIGCLYASGAELISEATRPQPHKSFFDFLTSLRAPPEFRVDRSIAHHELVTTCFRIMQEELHFNMGGFDSPQLDNHDAPCRVPEHVIYACASFIHHLVGSGQSFLPELHSWAKDLFLFWLEVLGLSGKAGQKIITSRKYWQVIQLHLALYTMLTQCHLAG